MEKLSAQKKERIVFAVKAGLSCILVGVLIWLTKGLHSELISFFTALGM